MLSGMASLGGCAGVSGGGGGASWTREQLDRVDAVARANGGNGWAAWENGHLKKSWQKNESGPVLSITKVLAGLGCAKAAGEGWLRAEERVSATISEWQGVGGKNAVTVRMLLQMTAGLEGGAAKLYRGKVADKGRVALDLRQVDAPGTMFRYGPACWEVLGELLHRKAVARGETLEGFLRRGVMRPVGLRSHEWKSDGRGRVYLSTGAKLSVVELGRLGKVIGELASGSEAAGIGAGAFREMTKGSSVNPHFGGGLWRNGRGRPVEFEEVLDPPKGRSFWGGVCLSRRQPASMLALIGSAGQRVFVWPESRRVVARIGYSGQWRDGPLLAAL